MGDFNRTQTFERLTTPTQVAAENENELKIEKKQPIDESKQGLPEIGGPETEKRKKVHCLIQIFIRVRQFFCRCYAEYTRRDGGSRL